MGLLPLSPCAAPEPPETNCAWLADTGAEILAAALEGLIPFIPTTGCGDSFDTYLSMGPPVAEHYDALSIYLVRYGPTPAAAARMNGAGGCDGVYPQTAAQWEIHLWENCYPTPERVEEHFVVPAPEKLSVVNEWVYAHGMAFYNSLLVALTTGSWELPHQIIKTTIGDLLPLGPQGAAVGWKTTVTTTVTG